MNYIEVPLRIYFQARKLCVTPQDSQELAISVQPSDEEDHVKIPAKFVPSSFFEKKFDYINDPIQALKAIQDHWEVRHIPNVAFAINKMIRRILK